MNWCKWLGHRRVRIPDSATTMNLAYCKRCGYLMKWKNKLPMEYISTSHYATVKLNAESNPESK